MKRRFYNKKLPKVDSSHTFLAVISLDSAFQKDGNYLLCTSHFERVEIYREKSSQALMII